MRVYNFSAGPAMLPEEVLKKAAEESDIDVCSNIVSEWGKLIVGSDSQAVKGQALLEMLDKIQTALDNFDTLEIDEVNEKMSKFIFTEKGPEYFKKLKEAAENYDLDSCNSIVKEWRENTESAMQ